METTVDKLKLTLNKIGLSEYGYGSYSDPNKSFNKILSKSSNDDDQEILSELYNIINKEA